MADLQALFQAISQAQDEAALRSQLLPLVRTHFTATKAGLFFFDQLPTLERKFDKALQRALSTEHNPVLRYIVERHSPVHEAVVVSPKAWKLICPRADHRHVMAGPLVSQGQLVGGVGLTRVQGLSAFETQDLMDLSALCLHLSAWVATICSIPIMVDPEPLQQIQSHHRLTPRELEIAELVAKGYTNAAIGTELWITENTVKQALKRMFRKLEVSSRTEMVTQVFSLQL